MSAATGIVVDLDELAERCVASLQATHPHVAVQAIHPLVGGASSFTFRIALSHISADLESVVLKLAPPGLPPVGNRDVLRQARLLRMLGADGRVPVPPVICDLLARKEDDAPGFLMGFVPGESYEPNMDGESPSMPTGEQVSSRMTQAVKILSQLHSLDLVTLGAVGEPVITPVAEVERWARAFETVDPQFRDGADELRDLLLSDPPPPMQPRLSHGDYRLGNMLAAGGVIRAVIDWEIWCVADPRVDLAWFLMLVEPSSQPLAVWKAPGMPTEAEVIRAYEQSVGAKVEARVWFDALVRYKQAAISALVVKNNRRRAVPDPAIERHAANTFPALAGGLERLRKG